MLMARYLAISSHSQRHANQRVMTSGEKVALRWEHGGLPQVPYPPRISDAYPLAPLSQARGGEQLIQISGSAARGGRRSRAPQKFMMEALFLFPLGEGG